MLRRSIVVGLLLAAQHLCAEPLKVSRATGSVIRGAGKIQTGSSSRLELELPYLAIVRIGSNTDFKFSPDAKKMSLKSGTLMLSVPQKTEGVEIESGSVVTALTKGALEMSNVGGQAKVIALDGKIAVSLAANRSDSRSLKAGEMVNVPAGATQMPPATAIRLGTLLKTSALLNMGPFPGLRAIKQNATQQTGPPGLPFFVTGGFDPDWGGGGASSLSSLGPAATAAMIARMEANVTGAQVPQLAPNAVLTQAQLNAFEAAGMAVPASNQRALTGAGLQIIGGKIRSAPPPTNQPGQPNPQPTPPAVRPTPPPVATPRPMPTQGLPRPRPTLRPPIAVP